MFKNIQIFAIAAFLIAEVCRADPIDDAQTALGELRQVSVETLNANNDKHIELAEEIESAAFETTESVSNVTEEFTACVNKAVEDAFYLRSQQHSGLIDYALQIIYDKENQIVVCGKTDTECLTLLTNDIKELTDGFPVTVADFLEEDGFKMDEKIDVIKACAQEI